LLHVELTYPSAEDELEILQRDRARLAGAATVQPAVDVATVLAAREEVKKVHIDAMLERYIVTLVGATRDIDTWAPAFSGMIEVGASPRASLAIARAACAHAYLAGREFVTPDDILEVAPDCLRHRIIPSFTARMEKIARDVLIQKLLETVPVP